MNAPTPADLPSIHLDSWDRLTRYVIKTGRPVAGQLGWEYEGLVYATDSKTAIKVYRHLSLYENERNVYRRLAERDVQSVQQFSFPRLVASDDELWVVEMSIVSPPFILDFAGAYLDRKPPFDAEQVEAWEEEKADQFEDRWPEVRSAISCFEAYGIYLNDVKPGNVMFSE